MATRELPIDPRTVAAALTAIQAGDAVACATLPIIQDELARLGCPPWLRTTIPALKAASAVGLLAGRRRPWAGRLTTDALAAYFVCALGAHARVRDEPWRYVAAVGMLGIVLVARQAYREPSEEEVVDLTGQEPSVVDLTTDLARDGAHPSEG